MTMRTFATFLAVLLSVGSALADECPDEVSDDSGARRLQAKRWFSTGEDRTKIGDDLGALKAFQCSMKFVPHGFTAFNIAQIAERVGDLELAIAGYNKYLLLVPEAKDSDDINRKILALKERLARVRQETAAAKTPPPPQPRPMVARPAPVAPPPLVTQPAREPRAEPSTVVDSTGDEPSGPNYRLYAWISYGSAAALIAGGLVTNLLARSKMDSCRTRYSNKDTVGADSECSSARALAYTSYALFGVGGAAAVAGTFFVLRPTDSTEVAMSPLREGGLILRWGGSF